MTNIFIEESYINATEGHRLGDSGVYETSTDSKKKLFKRLQRAHGKCVSKVYIGDTIAIGWVFQKKLQYEDCKQFYIAETWVTLHKAQPVITKTYSYLDVE